MSTEILSSVLRGLMEHEAKTLTNSQLANLEVLYRRAGEDRVKQFSLDSSVNQLPYSRHKEELAVHTFGKLLRPAINRFLENPVKQQLPSWTRVLDCESNLQNELEKAGT